MNPARFRWGILLIIIGGLLILNNLDILDWWVWEDIVALWPLILIAIGVEKIFAKSRWEFIAYLAPVALAVAVFWVAFSGFSMSGNFDRSDDSYRYQLDAEDGVACLDVTVETEGADINVTGAASGMFRGQFRLDRSRPDIDYEVKDSTARITISEAEDLSRWLHSRKRHSSGNWDLRFTETLPLTLNLKSDRGRIDVNSRQLPLGEIVVESSDGVTSILIGKLRDIVKVTFDGEGAEYILQIPPASGLRIGEAGDQFEGLFEALDMIRKDGYYISNGYDTLSPKIELQVSPNISQLTINRY